VKNSPVTAVQGDDEMSVIFDNKVFGSNFGSGTLAVTVLGYRNGNFEETDTIFNMAISWDSYRGPLTPPVFDFHRVAIHEFGHTLGLDHPDQAQPPQHVVAIMNSVVSNLDTLAQDDINGVTAIYGTGPAYNSIPNAPVLMNLSTRGTTLPAIMFLSVVLWFKDRNLRNWLFGVWPFPSQVSAFPMHWPIR